MAPHEDRLQYYPTPSWLVDKAWALFQSRAFDRVLDVCAGTGAMADGLRRLRDERYRSMDATPVDCIEIDIAHHPTLREKGYSVVALDVETFEGYGIYSHIVSNPPFSRAANYVLRAWDGLWEGEIAAILNAETLRNAYTAERKRLADLIRQHGSVEIIANAFKGEGVQREADVDVALVYLRKPAECAADWLGPLIDGLRVDAPEPCDFRMPQELALPQSFVDQQVTAFRMAVKAMREAVRARVVADMMSARIGRTMAGMASGAMEQADTHTSVRGRDVRALFCSGYNELKDRAWASVLRSTEALSRLSQKVQRQAEERFEEIKKLEFTQANVWGFLLGLVENQPALQMDMMCDVFDAITRYHTTNAVWYRGWKSNDRHREAGMRIRMSRFILPGHATEAWSSSPKWQTTQFLSDLDNTFALLDGVPAPARPLASVFSEQFAQLKTGARVASSYFDVRYFRQAGTIHFFPTRRDLIDRLNRWVGRHRRWLPPEGQQGTQAFWKAYEAAEAMDNEVRAALARTRSGSRFGDPLWDMRRASADADTRLRAHSQVVAALESVLAERGLLEVLAAEEARVHVEGGPPPLKLAA